MPLVIVPIYAALLALLFVMLSLAVVRQRRSGRVAIGTAGDRELERRVRVHGNFAEYVPFGIVLLAVAAAEGAYPFFLHLWGAALLAGRLCHFYGIALPVPHLQYRVAGMMLTFTVFITVALYLLAAAFVL